MAVVNHRCVHWRAGKTTKSNSEQANNRAAFTTTLPLTFPAQEAKDRSTTVFMTDANAVVSRARKLAGLRPNEL